MSDEQSKRDMIAYRTKNFDCEVKDAEHQFLSGDELTLRVTHNGWQWQSITVFPSEALVLMQKLRAYLKGK